MSKIHVTKGGKNHGPFTIDELNEKLKAGEFVPTNKAWIKGMSDWESLESEVFAKEGVKIPVSDEPPPPISSESTSNETEASGPPPPLSAKSANGPDIEIYYRWLLELWMLFPKPLEFYRRRASEGTLIPPYLFLGGMVFATQFIALLFVAMLEPKLAYWSFLLIIPLFWTIVSTIRGLLMSIIIKKRNSSPFSLAFAQGVTIDAYSWITFLLTWFFFNLIIFGFNLIPKDTGGFILWMIVLFLSRIHCFVLALMGLAEVSKIHKAIAMGFMLLIEMISSILVFIIALIIVFALL